MNSATIKLFLPYGDPRRLRTAEISNWSGKAIASPRTDLEAFLGREELAQAGVYILTGTDPTSDDPMCYIGEGEIIRERIKQHRTLEFWVQAIAFVSKDENLTKGHIKYLEGRLIEEAMRIGRFRLANSQASGARLPEADREDMEVFFTKVKQLLPVLGTELLTAIADTTGPRKEDLFCRIKKLVARGRRTSSGFVVFKGSQAVPEVRPSAAKQHPFVVSLREKLLRDGTLVQEKDHLVFTRDAEFNSPSAAAGIIHGGGANGPLVWKTKEGKPLREMEGA